MRLVAKERERLVHPHREARHQGRVRLGLEFRSLDAADVYRRQAKWKGAEIYLDLDT